MNKEDIPITNSKATTTASMNFLTNSTTNLIIESINSPRKNEEPELNNKNGESSEYQKMLFDRVLEKICEDDEQMAESDCVQQMKSLSLHSILATPRALLSPQHYFKRQQTISNQYASPVTPMDISQQLRQQSLLMENRFQQQQSLFQMISKPPSSTNIFMQEELSSPTLNNGSQNIKNPISKAYSAQDLEVRNMYQNYPSYNSSSQLLNFQIQGLPQNQEEQRQIDQDTEKSEAELLRRRNMLIDVLEQIEDPNQYVIKSKQKSLYLQTRSQRGSRYRGVSKNGKKWQVMIVKGIAKKYLGAINSELKAARLYDKYAMIIQGVQAKTNFSYTKKEILKLLDEIDEEASADSSLQSQPKQQQIIQPQFVRSFRPPIVHSPMLMGGGYQSQMLLQNIQNPLFNQSIPLQQFQGLQHHPKQALSVPSFNFLQNNQIDGKVEFQQQSQRNQIIKPQFIEGNRNSLIQVKSQISPFNSNSFINLQQ